MAGLEAWYNWFQEVPMARRNMDPNYDTFKERDMDRVPDRKVAFDRTMSRLARDGMLGRCARSIAAALYMDSHVPVKNSEMLILDALTKDMDGKDVDKDLLTEEEINFLVMGGDNGKPPVELVERFPNVERVLKSFF